MGPRPDERRGTGRSERGETLVELVVAVAILGIAGVAMASGMFVSVRSSTSGRSHATGGAYVRSFAEAIQQSVDANGGFPTCANAASTYAALVVPGLGSGATATYTKKVTDLKTWTGKAWGSTCVDGRAQLVTLTVKSASDATYDAAHDATETLTVVVRKPCNGPAGTLGDDPCTG